MKTNAFPLLALALALGATLAQPAHARGDPARDLDSFNHWLTANLACSDDFMEQVQDKKFLARAKALGIDVKTDWQEGDTPSGDFFLREPITVAGQDSTQIHYWGDSGAEFYATVAVSAEKIAKTIGGTPVPARLKHDFDAKTIAISFVRPAAKDERLAPAIFVRTGAKAGTAEVGCRYFDG